VALKTHRRTDTSVVFSSITVSIPTHLLLWAIRSSPLWLTYSKGLNDLRRDLQHALSVRQVGSTIYLAQFAVYIELITQRPIPWNVLSELVNAARPENWKEKQVDSSLLQKNYKNFARRNKGLYREIQTDIAAYLGDCAESPDKEKPTLAAWTLKRKPA
jgi:hypothetical protein